MFCGFGCALNSKMSVNKIAEQINSMRSCISILMQNHRWLSGKMSPQIVCKIRNRFIYNGNMSEYDVRTLSAHTKTRYAFPNLRCTYILRMPVARNKHCLLAGAYAVCPNSPLSSHTWQTYMCQRSDELLLFHQHKSWIIALNQNHYGKCSISCLTDDCLFGITALHSICGIHSFDIFAK